MTAVRVQIVRSACAGYANCLDVAPDIFDLDEHDVAVVVASEFPSEQRQLLEDAAHRCPAKAIIVTDAD